MYRCLCLLAVVVAQVGVAGVLPRGPVDMETPAVTLPFADAADPRTVGAVMGVRRVEATAPNRISMVLGGATDLSEANNNPQGFNIYSPTGAADAYAWAAAELAHTTGLSGYTTDFQNSTYTFTGSIWTDTADARMRGAIAYAMNDHPNTSASLRTQMRNALVSLADIYITDAATYAYPFVKSPYSPLTWGSGAYPSQLGVVTVAYHLTGATKYLKWHTHSCDLSLGANPLNLTWTSGLGDRCIASPMHLWGWNTYQGTMPPGLQCEGPYGRDSDLPGRSMDDIVPSLADTPDLYQYWDVRYNPGTQEGVVANMVRTAAAYALLLPDEARLPSEILECTFQSTSNAVISWRSVAGHSYTVSRSTNLLQDNWQVLTNGILSTSPLSTCTIRVDRTESFYRILWSDPVSP